MCRLECFVLLSIPAAPLPGAIPSQCVWIPFITLRRVTSCYVSGQADKSPRAEWTNLWRFYHTLRGDIHLVNLRAHQKYGPVVRTGPNNLDLDLPALVKTVYSADGRFRKTEFYPPASTVVNGRVAYNLFSLRDPIEHARQKRPVAKHYSLAGTLSLQPHVDDTIRLLCRSLEERYVGADEFGEGFDLGEWVKMYAWDVIGQITFSKHFGYLSTGKDFDGHLCMSDMGADYLSSVSQIPWLDRILDKNPIFPIGGATALLGPTMRRLEDRYAGRDDRDPDQAAAQPDFLDRFLEVQRAQPDVVDRQRVLSYLSINMLAGADTTAITIKAVLYYALRTDGVWGKLVAACGDAGLEPGEIPSFAQSRAVPYLEAVVREAMRVHPGVAMVLPRCVPDGGLELPDGKVVPPGTSVGMNPFVLGRNRTVWGPDADDYKPERWLRADGETEEAFTARLAVMNAADLTFGAGSRVCLGKHLGLLQAYKVVATLAIFYDLELVEPEKECIAKMQIKSTRTNLTDQQWQYETKVVHAGLDNSRHGECTVPIYNSASFKFPTSASAEDAFRAVPDEQRWVYSRFGNPTNDAFEKRMAALEDGNDAVSLASGAATTLTVAMSLAGAGDNVIVSNFTHGGTFHQFKIITQRMGIETRFCDTNDLPQVRSLVDNRTKFIFTETIGNPKFSIADLEPLAAIAHDNHIPLVVDATFTAAGYFCQPARWGADIILHSATKWIGGHGTTLGGVAIETGRSDWQANGDRFPQLQDLYKILGNRAYMQMLKWDFMRDTGACLAPASAQQLCVGLETLPLRCERQAGNAAALARWLSTHPRVAWVRYLGLPDHPYHDLARKYLTRGFGTVLTFGLRGGEAEALALIDALDLVTNTPNVGDRKTIVGHHWSTTHAQCSEAEMENMGVYADLLRLSVGIEHIDDIKRDFERAFERTAPAPAPAPVNGKGDRCVGKVDGN
ncbi:uncharacterized protein PgNI_09239 [Pyricularia grisea]|uniref:Uncharacterized protein n=1 Tax=Pyricularia grisea TaxID=148305 RepID=A0A6P8ATL0_PYRGI|nr:uncharacterized protein PgNI_09239 [Pyricularia grisea]TLD05448.1 hypothetical protein PgNI_09239 [Pyricularia grisea]